MELREQSGSVVASVQLEGALEITYPNPLFCKGQDSGFCPELELNLTTQKAQLFSLRHNCRDSHRLGAYGAAGSRAGQTG